MDGLIDQEKELLDGVVEQLHILNRMHERLTGNYFYQTKEFKDFVFKLFCQLNVLDEPLDMCVRKQMYRGSEMEFEVRVSFDKFPVKHEEEEIGDALKRDAEGELC